MEDQQTAPQPPIIDQLKEYVQTRLQLAKYEAVEKTSAIVAEIIADLVMAIALFLTFLFASVTLACYLAQVLKSNWAGFGCVTLLYLLLAILVMTFKKGFEKPIINTLIKKLIK